MDDFEYYGDQPGDYDMFGSYGDVSNLFDYDLSGLFDSFSPSDLGFDLADLNFGDFDLGSLDFDMPDLSDAFNFEDLSKYVEYGDYDEDFGVDISGVGSTGDADIGTGQAGGFSAEDIPGFGNQTAGEFGAEDIYNLKEQGLSDEAVKQIAGDYLSQSAVDEALANYGSGLSAEETASFLDELDTTREGIELQTLNDLQFAVTDATTLWKNTGDVAAVQQNLIASGLDPLLAADLSNMAAMGMSESDMYKQISDYYGDDAKYGEAFNKADKPFWDGSYSSSAVTPTGDSKGGGSSSSSSSSRTTSTNTPDGTKKNLLPALLGGIMGALTAPKVGGARGYQGSPAGLTASRAALSPAGAPGSGGKRFISQTRYAADGGLMELMPTQPNQSVTFMANGGMAKGGQLGGYSDGGRMLKGPGDGMSDSIPASIGGKRPARLADGEFVMPADVVSHLGNGSTDAGADVLYEMMERVRKARTGNPKQGRQINPNKFVPKVRT